MLVTANMNGLYEIANPNNQRGEGYSTEYKAKYFDVYSPPISSRYSQVYWTMMAPVALDADIVERFANKTIAIVGYESDQVFKNPGGDMSVPITWAYNHHYCAWMLGAGAEMTHDPEVPLSARHGHPTLGWKAVDTRDPVQYGRSGQHPVDPIPHHLFFSEGNGGEYRKSYHGYPGGNAQLLYSPTLFHITPMQIDTRNRDYNGSDFRAGILPKASQAPPHAHYSGLLECPCTDRISRITSAVYYPVYNGTCTVAVVKSAEECFDAIANLSIVTAKNISHHAAHLPSNCSIVPRDGQFEAVWNSMNTTVPCGSSDTHVFTGTTDSLIKLELTLDSKVKQATITMTGPDSVWFGVGFQAQTMADEPYVIVVNGTGGVEEHTVANHAPGVQLANTVRVLSNTVVDGIRSVVMTRAFVVNETGYYMFSEKHLSIPFIEAIGSTAAFSYHKLKSSARIALFSATSPSCICRAYDSYQIGNGTTMIGFNNNKCVGEPHADLLRQHNPTCKLDTYAGGLSCCHHDFFLLDKEQKVPDEVQTYHLKFRFYYEDYVPPQPQSMSPVAKEASHRSLIRLYLQTEAWSAEYDIPRADAHLPPEEHVHTITAHFQLRDAVGCNPDKNPEQCGIANNTKGARLIYAGPHCHAPSCLSMDLVNGDTGALLCHVEPIYGKGSGKPYDEKDYLALPPCLWGRPEDGLVEPPYLSWNTNLTMIKRNNNTYGHYGEMASWQMRGITEFGV